MSILAFLAFSTAFALTPTSTPTPSTLEVSKSRAVVVAGPIARGNLAPLSAQLLVWSLTQPHTPIDIVIDSPGGDIYTGFQFINVMEAVRARGTRLRCFVPSVAASMAFQILLHCDERYTLDHAFLLWHGVRVFGTGGQALTAPGAADLARDLAATDRSILRELDAALGLPPAIVRYHFIKETLHLGRDLAELAPKFITSRPAIPGLFEALVSAPRNPAPEPSLGGDTFMPGEIVYLDPSWEERP